jgi:hypothetical protein
MFRQEVPISIASPDAAPFDNKRPSNQPKTPPIPPIRRTYVDRGSVLKYVLLFIATIYMIGSAYFMYYTYSVYEVRPRVAALEERQKTLEANQAELNKKVHARLAEFKQSFGTEVGVTKQELTLRAAELEAEQKAASAKLAATQTQQSKQLAAVSGEVSSVKTDVGTAKADIQKTQTDLAATSAKLAGAMGDLGVQSGLIAHNAGELEELKHRGDRSYYDFTLQKNARTRIANISLILKKVDPKKSTFTLTVLADDKTIEKKDRTLSEPLQFYTGPDHVLYELVVFTAQKNGVTGYLSTPKNSAPPPPAKE